LTVLYMPWLVTDWLSVHIVSRLKGWMRIGSSQPPMRMKFVLCRVRFSRQNSSIMCFFQLAPKLNKYIPSNTRPRDPLAAVSLYSTYVPGLIDSWIESSSNSALSICIVKHG
jgi:hypothetical protein